jgi:hypothetical protein
MKKIFTLLTILCFGMMAQAQPQKINYQAVAVNASGVTVKNRVISLKLSILDSSSTGSVLYSETHQPTTDGSGQFRCARLLEVFPLDLMPEGVPYNHER